MREPELSAELRAEAGLLEMQSFNGSADVLRRAADHVETLTAERDAERGRREAAEAKLAQVTAALRELISSIDLRDRMVSVRAYKRAFEVLPEPEKP
jgi:hypothetical protein